MRIAFTVVAFCFSILSSTMSMALDTSNIAGLYKGILFHENTNFYQYAKITLRTVNPEGQMKISANVKVFFGPAESNEYLTYEFNDVPLNILTRQLAIKSDTNDVSMIGFLRGDKIQGDWFSSLVGKVGKFEAQKENYPDAPTGGALVESLSGNYRGTLSNTHSESNLPEKLTVSFVTTQDTSGDRPRPRISGSVRFYLGDFGSTEYIEVPFEDVQFNFYNRFLTAKTKEYRLTFRGTMNQDGSFNGVILSDALGHVATTTLKKPVN